MSSSSLILSWNEAKDKKVKSSDEKDLGKVYNATKDYIEIKEGRIGKKTYFVPKYFVQGYDGDNIWISLEKEDVKRRFERERPPRTSQSLKLPTMCKGENQLENTFPILITIFQDILQYQGHLLLIVVLSQLLHLQKW